MRRCTCALCGPAKARPPARDRRRLQDDGGVREHFAPRALDELWLEDAQCDNELCDCHYARRSA